VGDTDTLVRCVVIVNLARAVLDGKPPLLDRLTDLDDALQALDQVASPREHVRLTGVAWFEDRLARFEAEAR